MLRSMFQIYVNGSGEAVKRYQRAFDATLVASFPSEDGDGSYYHAELDVYGQILAVAEAKYMINFAAPQSKEAAHFFMEPHRLPGNTMQLCLHFGQGNADKVKQGYEALKEGSLILSELGPTDFSPCMVDFIDPYGVRWCLFE